jgi:trehalose 6-phosphate phosphatase
MTSTHIKLPKFDTQWALFLDVDGTLLDIAPQPDGVTVTTDLLDILSGLSLYGNGAIALISGRPISELDTMFSPIRICIAGLHGLERRDYEGRIHSHQMPDGDFQVVKRKLVEFAGQYPGILIEDKGPSIAVHYRLAPQHRQLLENVIRDCMDKITRDFHLQSGKMVFEIKPKGKDKGTAIAEFIEEKPFLHRKPVFIGDDITDEDGFMVINQIGGYSIKVGEGPTLARWRLDDSHAVQYWLASYLSFLQTQGTQ